MKVKITIFHIAFPNKVFDSFFKNFDNRESAESYIKSIRGLKNVRAEVIE